MIARIGEVTGTYTTALYAMAAVMALALVLPLVPRPPRRLAASSGVSTAARGAG